MVALRPETVPLRQEYVHWLKRIRTAQTVPTTERSRSNGSVQVRGAPLLQLVVGRCVRAA
ncbi:MAG: hypothetical protein NTV68_08815 [Methanomicrobiales archaeon]|nr:hypothetical protein [Methanomicrobiales archaeon]